MKTNSTKDFLKTKTTKAKLIITLDVINEFLDCEGEEQWALTPFLCWQKLEELKDYLEKLTKEGQING